MNENRSIQEFVYDGVTFLVPHIDLLPPHTAEELAAIKGSIARVGVLDPIKVVKGRNLVIDGHTRLTIARELGIPLKQVPFREIDADDDIATMMAVFCNTVRRNLDKEAKARLARELRRRCHWSSSKIATATGFPEATVRRYLAEPLQEGEEPLPGAVVGRDGKTYPAHHEPPRRPAGGASPEAGRSNERPDDGSSPGHADPPQAEGAPAPEPFIPGDAWEGGMPAPCDVDPCADEYPEPDYDAATDSHPDDDCDPPGDDEQGGGAGAAPSAPAKPPVSDVEMNCKRATESLGALLRALSRLGLYPDTRDWLRNIKKAIDDRRRQAA